MKLDDIPQIQLSPFPTPLQETPRLAEKLNLRKLFIKRDDCATLGMGGNKVRKLEFLMADAINKKSNVILTDGGPQSNHARLTAAACCKLGIPRCILFLGGPKTENWNGNLLLDIILGAEIKYMEDANVKDMESAMTEEEVNLKNNGYKPYVIPIGGSSPIGALGYVNAMRELSQQLPNDEKNPQIFLAVGSGGTLAGCSLGVKMFLPDADIIGISVAGKADRLSTTAAEIANKSAELIDSNCRLKPEDIKVIDKYYGKMYGVSSEAGNKAILTTAQTEGIFLDPVYTGKAMSGLVDMVEKNLIDRERTTVFIHTGGTPGLFAFEKEFKDLRKEYIK